MTRWVIYELYIKVYSKIFFYKLVRAKFWLLFVFLFYFLFLRESRVFFFFCLLHSIILFILWIENLNCAGCYICSIWCSMTPKGDCLWFSSNMSSQNGRYSYYTGPGHVQIQISIYPFDRKAQASGCSKDLIPGLLFFYPWLCMFSVRKGSLNMAISGRQPWVWSQKNKRGAAPRPSMRQMRTILNCKCRTAEIKFKNKNVKL